MFNFESKLLRFFVVISERHMEQVLSWWSHYFVQDVESAAFSKVVLVPMLIRVLLNKLWFVRSRLFVEADCWKRNELLLLDCRFFTLSFIGTFISCFLYILEGFITSLILGSLLSPRCDNSSRWRHTEKLTLTQLIFLPARFEQQNYIRLNMCG